MILNIDFPTFNSEIHCIQVDPIQKYIAIGTTSGEVLIWCP